MSAASSAATAGKSSAKSEIARFNELPAGAAVEQMLRCCAGVAWAEQMAARRPYHSLRQLTDAAERIWRELPADDWLQAFRGHPEIGAAATGDARDEQAGAAESSAQTRDALARLNREYRRKFGFIFLVCASGQSGEAMLEQLRARLGNSRGEELANAAEEQCKITRLRLRKLFAGESAAPPTVSATTQPAETKIRATA